MKKAAIILPTYNEKGNIDRLINELEQNIFPRIKNYEMHIMVVDDSSPDGTAQVVEKLQEKYKNLHLLKDGPKDGLGAAYVRGMSAAIDTLGADVLFEMDADLSHDPEKIPEFLEKIDEGYDFVIATRYSAGGSIPKDWGFKRKFYSVVGNWLIRLILTRFYIHDWTGGYRAIKKEVFLKIKNDMKQYKGYTFQVASLHKAIQNNFKVSEVPIHFIDRTKGESKIGTGDFISNTMRYIIVERMKELKRSPFMKYAITGFMGYIINAVSLEFFADILMWPPFISAMVAAELSIIWNFIVNNAWAFSHHKITSPTKFLMKFVQFNLVSFGSVLINSTIIYLGTHWFGNTPLVRQISLVIAIGFFVVPYSYSMYNIFIWKRWHISFLSRFQKMVG
jgi:dolichol-phosphate mannosyltransferase